MGKFNPTKFKVKHGHGGVLGEARFITKQSSGKNNANVRAFVSDPDKGFAGSAASIPNPFVANAVHFDGSNDFLLRFMTFENDDDSKEGLVSFWINKAADGSNMTMYVGDQAAGDSQLFNMMSSNRVQLVWRNAAGEEIWIVNSDRLVLVADGWTHILASVNSATGARHLYINDVVDDPFLDLFGADRVIDYGTNDYDRIIGASNDSGDDMFDGDIAEMYVSNKYLDLSDPGNRRKFITADGKPADMNNNGMKPLGFPPPMVYCTGRTVHWHLNASGNGEFVVTGELTDAATSPSD